MATKKQLYRILVEKRPWVLYPFETPRSNITLHTHTSSPNLFITQITLFFVSADIEIHEGTCHVASGSSFSSSS
jgi:hypothetical protein